jgi:hypothetical protein
MSEDIIGVYLDDCLICVPCSTTGEGERVTAEAEHECEGINA